MKIVAQRFLIVKAAVLLILMSGCSAERKNLVSKTFHNTTARYNAYFIAREKMGEVEQAIQNAHVHNYNEVLKVFPLVDSSAVNSVDKQLEECLQKASIAIQRHKNSKWVDDSYILVGKARYYNADFVKAIATYKLVNTKSEDKDARHAALIDLMRTYIDYKEENNAIAVSDYLKKETLNKTNQKNLFLTRAYYAQIKGDSNALLKNLELAIPLVKKKDGRAKYLFILGQLYQQKGDDVLAYEHYEKSVKSNPTYELSFYARLNMYQTYELSKNRETDKIRKYYGKLLRDAKNKEYRDKIYYEMGGFELKQDNLQEAIANYIASTRASVANPRQKALSFLQLGKIHFEKLKKFALAKSYYDSTLQSMPPDDAMFPAIQQRQKILANFVEQIEIIQLQDSLLALAEMDKTALNDFLDKIIAAKNKEEKQKEKQAEIANRRNATFNNTDQTGFAQNTTEGATWYFYNATAVARGQNEFQRIWGNRKLEDNWRRSDKDNSANVVREATAPSAEEVTAEQPVDQLAIDDAVKAEMIASIPYNQEEKHVALEAIENAYYKLGNIYNFDLNDKLGAIGSYETILTRFQESEYKAELYYLLYLLYKERDIAKSDAFKEKIIREFPNTNYARIIQNPNFKEDTNIANEQIRLQYKQAYALYQQGQFDAAQAVITSAKNAYPITDFADNLRLLEIMIIGKVENKYNYQFALKNFIENFKDSELIPYAQKLLIASEELAKKITDEKGAAYIQYFDQAHFMVVVYKPGQNLENSIPAAMEKFNKSAFKDWELKTGNLILDEGRSIVLISEFTDQKMAKQYLEQINQSESPIDSLDKANVDRFIISKDNFQLFYQSKDLINYLSFYKKFY